MDLHDDFYNRIKRWARQNNTTIEAVMSESSDGKWTQAVYYGWRQSDGLPKGENILALARYMGVSCDWLITGKEFEKSEKPVLPSAGITLKSEEERIRDLNKLVMERNLFPAKISPIVTELSLLDDDAISLAAAYVHALSDLSRKKKAVSSGIQKAI